MTRSRAAFGTAAALAAAGLALVAGCARPAATTSASFSSSAPSTSTPTTPSTTPSPTSPATTADPGVALDPVAVASPYPRGRAGTPAGGLPAVSTRTSRDPLVVTTAALRVLFGSDTALDTQPMDAEKRALPWLGGAFAAAVASAQIVAAPGAGWNGWAAHRAHLVVTVARGWDDGAPPDTPTAVDRQWLITQTPVGITGTRAWTGTPVRTVVYTTTTRTGGRWAVTTVKEAP